MGVFFQLPAPWVAPSPLVVFFSCQILAEQKPPGSCQGAQYLGCSGPTTTEPRTLIIVMFGVKKQTLKKLYLSYETYRASFQALLRIV